MEKGTRHRVTNEERTEEKKAEFWFLKFFYWTITDKKHKILSLYHFKEENE